MKILSTTPREDGFYMPAEYEPHEGCIMIWPKRSDTWPYGAVAACRAFVQIAQAIAESEKVTVCVNEKKYDMAREMLPDQVRVVEMTSNGSWARDYMPTFVKNKAGEIRGIDWGFNAWGGQMDGLYFPWDKDQKMARKFCDLMNVDIYDARNFILEGASFHVDGEGTAIVTASCLMSEGRNPELTREEIEGKLKAYLNVQKVIWLPYGLCYDETNGQVENICAFTAPGEVVLSWTDEKKCAQYEFSNACLEILLRERDAKGRRIRVRKLPLPSPIVLEAEDFDGFLSGKGKDIYQKKQLPASYVNFYLSNAAVVMPAFGDPMDKKAKKIMQQIFPEREVIQVKTRDILVGGGNIHSITQQIPTR